MLVHTMAKQAGLRVTGSARIYRSG